MSAEIAADNMGKPLAAVGGWRREVVADGQQEGRLLISRLNGQSTIPLDDAGQLRHPGLARVVSVADDQGSTRVVEEIGEGRPLSDGRCRLPRGAALAQELMRLLEALGYLHRQDITHGAVSRETVFSDGRRLLLTGTALTHEGSDAPAADSHAWAALAEELLEPGRSGELGELLLEAAGQVEAAVSSGRPIDAGRVVRAVNAALADPEDAPETDVADGMEEEIERSRSMRILLAALHFVGSVIVGMFTTVLTVALLGAAVAGGVLWFLDQLPEELPVPNVVGMERAKAEEELEAAGLELGRVRSVYREEVEPGHVAETSPPSGMTVREGREVTLVVSMGAARVKVPRLVGLKLDEADSVLEKKGLRLVDGGKMRSNMPEGEIVQQDPPPGRKIAQGQRVVALTSG
ncbi:MAG: PASTA domain-containing protein, partial [Armatimonadia bacterium]|nr:PASTA domain-containing protein [Armatimonadia bacterium]